MVFTGRPGPGSKVSLPVGNVVLLRPAEQLFEQMLAGWATQQTSRMLAAATIRARDTQVRRFADFCGTPPWEWAPGDVEEWTTSLVSGARPLAVSTVRAYQNAVALFCDHVTAARQCGRCRGASCRPSSTMPTIWLIGLARRGARDG